MQTFSLHICTFQSNFITNQLSYNKDMLCSDHVEQHFSACTTMAPKQWGCCVKHNNGRSPSFFNSLSTIFNKVFLSMDNYCQYMFHNFTRPNLWKIFLSSLSRYQHLLEINQFCCGFIQSGDFPFLLLDTAATTGLNGGRIKFRVNRYALNVQFSSPKIDQQLYTLCFIHILRSLPTFLVLELYNSVYLKVAQCLSVREAAQHSRRPLSPLTET